MVLIGVYLYLLRQVMVSHELPTTNRKRSGGGFALRRAPNGNSQRRDGSHPLATWLPEKPLRLLTNVLPGHSFLAGTGNIRLSRCIEMGALAAAPPRISISCRRVIDKSFEPLGGSGIRRLRMTPYPQRPCRDRQGNAGSWYPFRLSLTVYCPGFKVSLRTGVV